MTHFIIDRATWDRGRKVIDDTELSIDKVYLLNSTTGMKCCLGFCALQSGFAEKDIENIPSPMELECVMVGFNCYLSARSEWENSDFADQAIRINDDLTIAGWMREERLIHLFFVHGHTIEFTGPRSWVVFDQRDSYATYLPQYGSLFTKSRGLAWRFESRLIAEKMVEKLPADRREHCVVLPVK